MKKHFKYKFQEGGEMENVPMEEDFTNTQAYLQNLQQEPYIGVPVFTGGTEFFDQYQKLVNSIYNDNTQEQGTEQVEEAPEENKEDSLLSIFNEKLSHIDNLDAEFSEHPSNVMPALRNKYEPKEEGSSEGSVSYNIGNIKDPRTGQFRKYSTPGEGAQALVDQLEIYKTGRSRNNVGPNSSLYEAMAIYAPASDNNNPKQYAEFIAKRLGISPNTPIKNINTIEWAKAVSIMEGRGSWPSDSSETTDSIKFKSDGKYGTSNIGQQGIQIGNEIAGMLGYTPTFNSIYRDKKQQQYYVDKGVGASNSYHLSGNAIDIKPADWNKLTKEQQKELRTKYDVLYHNNHYHVEPK